MTSDESQDRNAMPFRQFLAWAWRETPALHRNRTNLLIHVLAVPLFVAGHLLLLAGIVIDPRLLAVAALCIVVSLLLQKFGHSLEQKQALPFAGRRDFLRRIYAEQFILFWRLLLSGQWYAGVKAGDTEA